MTFSPTSFEKLCLEVLPNLVKLEVLVFVIEADNLEEYYLTDLTYKIINKDLVNLQIMVLRWRRDIY